MSMVICRRNFRKNNNVTKLKLEFEQFPKHSFLIKASSQWQLYISISVSILLNRKCAPQT
jgi:hypothetical protein